jgi:lipopolysaccharide assembly protein A
MRFALIVLILLCAAAGALFGALNSEATTIDFYFFTFQPPKGAALLAALLIGWIVGGLVVYLGPTLRWRRTAARLRRRVPTPGPEPLAKS